MPSLPELIQARIEAALLHHERADSFVPDARRGMATGGPDDLVVRLTVPDVARLAAHAAEDWAVGSGQSPTGPPRG
jgi:hypothetical protein